MRISKNNRIYLGIGSALGFLMAAWFVYKVHFEAPADLGRKITLKYEFSVSNPSSTAIKKVNLLACTPLATTSTQRCKKNNINQRFEEVQDDAGNTLFKIQWELIPPYTTKIVSISSEVKIGLRSRRSDASPSDGYLASEALIESDHADIQEMAEKLKAKSGRETAHNIFDWIVEHIRYAGYVKKNRGALYALRHRNGDCTEFATLFVALCRASGIPARYVGGFVSSKSAVLNLRDYHNWAEFYHEGHWHLVDPQRKIFMDDFAASSYVAYKVILPSKGIADALITNIEGSGLKIRANI